MHAPHNIMIIVLGLGTTPFVNYSLGFTPFEMKYSLKIKKITPRVANMPREEQVYGFFLYAQYCLRKTCTLRLPLSPYGKVRKLIVLIDKELLSP